MTACPPILSSVFKTIKVPYKPLHYYCHYYIAGFLKPHLPFIMPQSFLDLYPADSIRLPANPFAPVDMPVVCTSLKF